MILHARKIPIHVEVVRWTAENKEEIWDFVGDIPEEDVLDANVLGPAFDTCDFDYDNSRPAFLWMPRKKAWVGVSIGDWIVKDPDGDFYSCDSKEFAHTYELLGESLYSRVPDTVPENFADIVRRTMDQYSFKKD